MFEICMQHPAKNALGVDLIAWLAQELDAAGRRPILLTGSDGAFSAGLNLKDVSALDDDQLGEFLESLDRLVARLFLHPAPVVAAINGHAIAGGCVLVQCCDHRVCVDDPRVKLGLNEVALGVAFPPRILGMLSARLTAAQVERCVLGAQLFAPREALALGLVDELAKDALETAQNRLEALAEHPAEAYASTKAVLRAGATELSPERERRFREEELPLWTSPAVRARMLAALKR